MELLEEAFHHMEDIFHMEDLEAVAFLVAVEEVTPVEGQADMASLVARHEAHQEVRPDRQTTLQTLTGSGVAPTMATGADNLRTPGPGTTRVFTNFGWKRTSRSGRGLSHGNIETGFLI